MKKTTRKLLAVLLAFTMLFGSSMTVFAQEYEWNELREGTILQNGDTISVTYDTLVECGYESRNSIRCQTAHCGRCKPHFIFGELISPIVPYRNLPQTLRGLTADCRSFV